MRPQVPERFELEQPGADQVPIGVLGDLEEVEDPIVDLVVGDG